MAREVHDLTHKLCAFGSFIVYTLHIRRQITRERILGEQNLCVKNDAHQDVVEVVGDSSSELSKRCHSSSLSHLLFEPPALRDISHDALMTGDGSVA